MGIYTKRDLEHAEKKATECEARGNDCPPGTASRTKWFEQARKWERTAEMVRSHLA